MLTPMCTDICKCLCYSCIHFIKNMKQKRKNSFFFVCLGCVCLSHVWELPPIDRGLLGNYWPSHTHALCLVKSVSLRFYCLAANQDVICRCKGERAECTSRLPTFMTCINMSLKFFVSLCYFSESVIPRHITEVIHYNLKGNRQMKTI